jgi:hypothetical protein
MSDKVEKLVPDTRKTSKMATGVGKDKHFAPTTTYDKHR